MNKVPEVCHSVLVGIFLTFIGDTCPADDDTTNHNPQQQTILEREFIPDIPTHAVRAKRLARMD
jgi:hypothetical protein